MHAQLRACNACRSVHNCISRMGCEMPSHNIGCLCNHTQRCTSTVALHEVCQETIRHIVQALWSLLSSYFTMLVGSVQYGRLFHPGHSTVNVRRAPHWPTATQTEHQDRVTIQVCLLVYGAMTTTFLISKTWNGQFISPGSRVQVHVLLSQ